MNLSYSGGISNGFKWLIIAGVLLLFGMLVNLRNDEFLLKGNGLVISSSILALISLIQFYQIFNAKKKYRALIEWEQKRMDENSVVIMEFTEEYFYFEDADLSVKINWKLFKGVRFINDTILLDIDRGAQTCFIISKSYVGDTEFVKIRDFVNKKRPEMNAYQTSKTEQQDLLDD